MDVDVAFRDLYLVLELLGLFAEDRDVEQFLNQLTLVANRTLKERLHATSKHDHVGEKIVAVADNLDYHPVVFSDRIQGNVLTVAGNFNAGLATTATVDFVLFVALCESKEDLHQGVLLSICVIDQSLKADLVKWVVVERVANCVNDGRLTNTICSTIVDVLTIDENGPLHSKVDIGVVVSETHEVPQTEA